MFHQTVQKTRTRTQGAEARTNSIVRAMLGSLEQMVRSAKPARLGPIRQGLEMWNARRVSKASTLQIQQQLISRCAATVPNTVIRPQAAKAIVTVRATRDTLATMVPRASPVRLVHLRLSTVHLHA